MIQAALLHSVSYSGTWGQHALSVEDFVDKAADLNYEGVMLMAKRPHLSVLDWGPKERAMLRTRIEKRNLRAVCIAGYTNFTADLEHSDMPHREIQIQHVTELARMAHDLGGKLVRVFTGYESGTASFGTQWKIVVDALRECARRAMDFDVTIGVQNHHDLANDYQSQYELIGEIGEPNCKALFDAWAPALQGTDLVAAARKMAPVTGHTTFANYSLRPRFRYLPELVNYERLTPNVQAVPIDEGFIDYNSFVRALEEAGFKGTIAYEMCSPLCGGGSLENLDRYARRFLEFIAPFRLAAA
jgi:sugar phosphate isomerase/epimerase